ncbi:Kinesin protein 1B [Apophysomyces sp. BC1034]|nr:Kinesin protein 1B [Apophysomyces sp. BC1015]KAG0181305.1 Kinesin protein 1B [Apophysomyces sp. BC1021]KAG0191749.1 Kinesin protein 1B [Apophysomyces sp. BC1034]
MQLFGFCRSKHLPTSCRLWKTQSAIDVDFNHSRTTAPAVGQTENEADLETRLKSIKADNMALMLALETQARMDVQEAREEKTTRRQSRLTFDLPEAPSRPKPQPLRRRSLADSSRARKNTRWSRWMARETPSRPLITGSKVSLIRRPLPTFGLVRFIGTVDFAEGQWIGVELESRVGNCDGSVQGKYYFCTDPHRGVFLTQDELIVI